MTREEQALTIIAVRHKIAIEYCEKKGWPTDPDKLTWEQIMKIRELPEWINALNNIE